MQFVKMTGRERAELLHSLELMPSRLRAAFSTLSQEEAATPGPGRAFAPVEQVWHLADLERDGFGVRIEALLSETAPYLPDFDGAAMARERNYLARSLAAGLEEFARARQHNLAVLKVVAVSSWSRKGTQEGIGEVSLCDIPGFMLQHDSAHEAEIAEWASARASRHNRARGV